jgi:hypothetical protein
MAHMHADGTIRMGDLAHAQMHAPGGSASMAAGRPACEHPACVATPCNWLHIPRPHSLLSL